MQPKKNSTFSLENRRGIHFQIGVIAALCIVLVSLEWSSVPPANPDLLLGAVTIVEPDIMQWTDRKEESRPKVNLPPILVPVPADQIDLSELEQEILDGLGWEIQDGPFIIPDIPDSPPEMIEVIFEGPVEIPAEFPGGEPALLKWLYSELEYPKIAQENGVEGRVFVRFIVTRHGKVKNPEIYRGVHPDLDEEVLRVVNMMPDFRPAMQNGQLVSVYMVLPVSFRLQ